MSPKLFDPQQDIFRFDPSLGARIGICLPSGLLDLSSIPSDAEIGIRQAIFVERSRRIIAANVLQEIVQQLLSKPARLAEPTAYFVLQHLTRIYVHQVFESTPSANDTPHKPHLRWTADANGTLHPLLNLDLRKTQNHVQRTMVDSTVKDQKLLESLVEQAVNATSTWFCKDLESRFDLQSVLELSDSALVEAYHTFLKDKGGTTTDRLSCLISFCAQNLAKGLAETLEPTLRQASLEQLEQLIGLSSPEQLQKCPPPKTIQDYLEVMSSSHYHAVRDALARKRFIQTDDSPWPTATLDKGHSRGYAELRPAATDLLSFIPPDEEKLWVDRMWRQREELSDLDADALDALSSIWLSQAKHIEQDAIAGVDEILEMRGIQPKKSGNGRRGGYHQQQRTEMLRALSHIQNLWMNMTKIEIYDEGSPGIRKGAPKTMAIKSRAFTITDMMGQLRLDGHMDVSRFIFRPGKVFASFLFGIGRQTALLSARALHYDPYRQTGEKRLTRYLSWQWRCQASSGCSPKAYRVDTLMEVIGEKPQERYPSRTRDRLETLMDSLCRDQVIRGWQYENWTEDQVKTHGWLKSWLAANLLLEPPTAIQDRYVELIRKEPGLPAPKNKVLKAQEAASTLGADVRSRRLELGLSQAQLGEMLEIHQTAVNRLERGIRDGTAATQKKLKAWLSRK